MCVLCGNFSCVPTKTEAALRKLLSKAQAEIEDLKSKLAETVTERDRWLHRLQRLECRLQRVYDAIDPKREI